MLMQRFIDNKKHRCSQSHQIGIQYPRKDRYVAVANAPQIANGPATPMDATTFLDFMTLHQPQKPVETSPETCSAPSRSFRPPGVLRKRRSHA